MERQTIGFRPQRTQDQGPKRPEHTMGFRPVVSYCCEYCGLYEATEPKCNKCEPW